MCGCTRRAFMFAAAGAAGAAIAAPARAATRADFIEAAFQMREQALNVGEQPYGAVVVRGGSIVGRGAARIRDRGWLGHAERMAMRDTQERFGREDLSDCVMYSTSRPCDSCRRAAEEAKLGRMYFGLDAVDAGKP
jgi:tRNA(Arg) A34 adenosine deaminase TadA